ncbi:MAG: phosphoethanolamine--lipid A transferase [Bdellovibrio sp.]
MGGRFFKFACIFFLITSSIISYYSDKLGLAIDRVMILNLLHTDAAEARGVLNFKLFMYFFIKGFIPSLIVFFIKLDLLPLKKRFFTKFKMIAISLIIIATNYLALGKTYTNFLRNHKTLRFYSNPVFFVYSTFSFINRNILTKKLEFKNIGITAKKVRSTNNERALIILVIGETARADRFSLNGYQRETNPLLKNQDIISYKNFKSCGTSTAISIPCMFSIFNRNNFDIHQAQFTGNLLDVLTNTQFVNILWRDNNSNSKGVADRVEYESFKSPEKNKICDPECRDIGMLEGLDNYIQSKTKGDILIVLHMMGSHGPEYFRRVPSAFNKFQPICKFKELEKCSLQEIRNSYDNTILYTDFFLNNVIEFLKKYSPDYETAMFYVSDHGESLGENGVFLHGLPYLIAPKEQTQVPAIVWFSEKIKQEYDWENMKNEVYLNKEFDHSTLFHSILGLLKVQTPEYNPYLDLFKDYRVLE